MIYLTEMDVSILFWYVRNILVFLTCDHIEVWPSSDHQVWSKSGPNIHGTMSVTTVASITKLIKENTAIRF